MEIQKSDPAQPKPRREFLFGMAAGVGATLGVGALGLKFMSGRNENKTPAPEAESHAPDQSAALAELHPGADGKIPLETISRDHFAQCLKSKFTVETRSGQPFEVVLVDVSAVKMQKVKDKRIETFSLLFQAPKDTKLEPKIMTLRNEKMGKFDVLLSPVGRASNYETVFTRFI